VVPSEVSLRLECCFEYESDDGDASCAVLLGGIGGAVRERRKGLTEAVLMYNRNRRSRPCDGVFAVEKEKSELEFDDSRQKYFEREGYAMVQSISSNLNWNCAGRRVRSWYFLGGVVSGDVKVALEAGVTRLAAETVARTCY
jgi:hypothetical protein